MKSRQIGPTAAGRLVLSLALLALVASLGACNGDDIQSLVGNRYPLGNFTPFGSSGGTGANSLQGTAIVVPRDTWLLRFGLIASSTGTPAANFRMALYTDSAGQPNTLVAASPPRTVVVGGQTVGVSPTPLLPGTYWLMALYDNTLNVSWKSGTGDVNAIVSTPFASPLPNPITSPTLSALGTFNYWIVVQD